MDKHVKAAIQFLKRVEYLAAHGEESETEPWIEMAIEELLAYRKEKSPNGDSEQK